MEMEVTFPGGVAVDASFGGFTVHTDQPTDSGGGNAAPSPFSLFFASLATCAGFYALRFCQVRQIDITGLGLTMKIERSDEGRIATVRSSSGCRRAFPRSTRARSSARSTVAPSSAPSSTRPSSRS
jgi:putative redox protein